jgi:hypothetical protein
MISATGAWGVAQPPHSNDALLSWTLAKYLKAEGCLSLVDFGCGLADYVKQLVRSGIPAIGYDGNPFTEQLSDGFGMVLDLSVPVALPTRFDWVMSLEVGEHLPVIYEQIFLNTLCRHACRGIILSWAIPGQGGHGHVNERTPDYIRQQLHQRGWTLDVKDTAGLRNAATLPWFKNTLTVFRPRID